jgi:hypothetical protein
MNAEDLARWSARAAFAFYVGAIAVWPKGRRIRWLWTMACAAMLVHVGIAFDQVHHWSHRAAYEATALQTASVVGLNWGAGIYANYALLLVWLVDMLWWWSNAKNYEERPRSVTWSIHGFLAFMWFNAAVIFAHGWMRWAGLVGFLLAAVMFYTQKKTASGEVPRKPLAKE